MKNTQEAHTLTHEVVSITCDRCKKTYDDWIEMQEAVTVSFRGGYGSIFNDQSEYECDLCQHCVKELLGPYLRVTND